MEQAFNIIMELREAMRKVRLTAPGELAGNRESPGLRDYLVPAVNAEALITVTRVLHVSNTNAVLPSALLTANDNAQLWEGFMRTIANIQAPHMASAHTAELARTDRPVYSAAPSASPSDAGDSEYIFAELIGGALQLAR